MSNVKDPEGIRQSRSDELTLEQIAITLRDFTAQALSYWWLFLFLFAAIGSFMIYKAYTAPVEYQATFTFMRDEDESGALSGVAAILQFGLGSSSGRFNLDRVLELARSRRIVQQTIFDKTAVEGSEDFLGNHLIDMYELDAQWAKQWPELADFRFVEDEVDYLGPLELRALKKLYQFIIGGEQHKGLLAARYSEESTILSLSATTVNPMVSIDLITSIYENLADYYVTKTTEKQQNTYEIVAHKADSIGQLLARAEKDYASFRDANQSLWSNIAKLQEQRLYRDIQKLNVIHAEALKNVEIADFSLKNATPVIQELDKPVMPLDPIMESKVLAAVESMILSLIIGSLIILGINLRRRIRAVV